MGHAESILSMLDAQRCRICGKQAVRGATVCLGCVLDEDILAEVLPPAAQLNPGKPQLNARGWRSPGNALRVAGG